MYFKGISVVFISPGNLYFETKCRVMTSQMVNSHFCLALKLDLNAKSFGFSE